MSGRRIRNGVIAAVLLALVVSIWLGVRDAERTAPALPGPQAMIFNKGFAQGQRLQTKAWALSYDRVQASPDGSVLDVYGVHDGAFFRPGKPPITMRADHAIVNTASKDFTIAGKVHFESVDGGVRHTFDTDAATWNNLSQVLTLPNTVRVGSDEKVLTIASVRYDVKSGALEIGKIQGTAKF